MNEFCEMKGIRREFSVARAPQQNVVAERKNKTLIEAARTMLADSKLSTTFWAKVVNTACYVQNKVLVIKPHNKTPYELFLGRKPALSFMRPFGCLVTILNTLDHLGIGPNWMFDIDTLAMSRNYQPVFARNQTNGNAGPKSSENKVVDGAGKKCTEFPRKENRVQDLAKEGDKYDQEKDLRDQEEVLRNQFRQESKRLSGQGEVANINSTNRLNTVSLPFNAVSSSFTTVDPGRDRTQRNEFESMFGQDKDANSNRMFTPVSDVGSTYVYLGGSIPINAATLPNADLLTNPLMPDLEDTADL
nr:ribonuclease H-like domain-containing protein [Tanacetum cinerariifolium]